MTLLLNKFQRENFIEKYRYSADLAPSYAGLEEYQKPYKLIQTIDGNSHKKSYSYYPAKDIESFLKQHPGFPKQRIIKSVRYPDMSRSKIRYYAEANKREQIELNGSLTTYEFNDDGNPIVTTDALGGVIEQHWSQDEGLTDAVMVAEVVGGEKTRYKYNTQGERTVIIYPDQSMKTNHWELDFSKLLSTQYADGSLETNEYDKRGNLLKKIEVNGLLLTIATIVKDRKFESLKNEER